MDKDILIKELILELGEYSYLSLKELEQCISGILGMYSVSKTRTTLPTTGDGSTTKFLFGEFIKDKLSEGKSQGTLKQYYLAINKLYSFVQKEVHLCTKEDIVGYLNYYRFSSDGKEKKPNTVTNRYLQISAFFSWLHKNNYITINPFDAMECPKSEIPIKSIITKGEFEKLVIVCEKNFTGIKQARMLAMITFCLESGVRASELCDLKISDIEWGKRCANIRNGKGGKPRKVFFGEKSEIRLREYLRYRNKKELDDYLFTSLNIREKKITVSSVEDDIKTLGKLSGITRIHPHLFRTTFATNMVSKGVPIPTVSKLMGHSSPETLTSYLVITDDDLEMAYKK